MLRPSVPLIIHGFAKNKELAEQLLKRGFYLSLGSKTHSSWNSALYTSWKEQLFVETDMEESLSILSVYEKIARTFAVDFKELEEVIEENYWFVTSKKSSK